MTVTRAVLVALVLLQSAPAAAQGLRKLHVDALAMRADHARVAVHEVFHLAIHVHVRENVAALDELVVPDVGTMQLEGDERHVTRTPSGTDVVETLTLEATAPGTFTFKGAYLDAIDARTGKPSRFSANPVRVVVVAPSAIDVQGYFGVWRFMIAVMLGGSAVLVAAAAVLAVVRLRRARNAAVVTVAAPAAAAPPAPPRTLRDEVADALRAYRSAPANGSLTHLRGALFVAAGATAGATLRDALAATADRDLRAALVAAERTAFGPAYQRDASSAALIDAAETWLSPSALPGAR